MHDNAGNEKKFFLKGKKRQRFRVIDKVPGNTINY